MSGTETLQIRLLGGMEVVRGGEPLVLPPSKKTRALLVYLVMTGRAHRRERLCDLLWDVPDDPRGALRWSLSKLRPLVDDPQRPRIIAGRDTVAFDADGISVDLLDIRRRLAAGIDSASTEQLTDLVNQFRGEFVEGLELPNCYDFHAWCTAEREEVRALQTAILRALISRLAARADVALPHARALVQIDPLSGDAQAELLRLLAATGRRGEAEHQYSAGRRLLQQLGPDELEALDRAWRRIASAPADTGRRPSLAGVSATPSPTTAPDFDHASLDEPPATVLVGRTAERARLREMMDTIRSQRREGVILLKGEPGIGKSRLLAALVATAKEQGATVLDGEAFEAESGRPYGPWIDALRRVPAVSVGPTLGNELAPLLPELGQDEDTEPSRDRLFGAVVELIAARAHSTGLVVLALDDVQWIDEASASLLHYVVRMNRHRPVMIVLAGREGELPDNEPMLRVLRGMRRDRVIDEIALGPLGDSEIAELVQHVAPEIDTRRVFAESAGNPLFALEVARALPHRQEEDMPQTVTELVRDRIDRLPDLATDMLRWAAVMGVSFNLRRLPHLIAADLDELVTSLEVLERHALLRQGHGASVADDTYIFAHDIVRQAVYAELSEPRRRTMHWRIAKTLEKLEPAAETVAAEIAYHAALAGDAGLATRSCITAGKRCLRLFANGEAEALARRGMHFAQQLDEPVRVSLLIELNEIAIASRRPERLDDAAHAIEALAERALDHGCMEHARLGFHMVSRLRWEEGDWSDAERHTLQAELVGRSADPKEHVVAMAEAARCLARLERDLSHAEALLLEANALSGRVELEHAAISECMGILCSHRGQFDEAADLYRHARDLSHRDGDRLGEFEALEHLVMQEFQRGRYDDAAALSDDLVAIGEKLREGSEAPTARALAALARYAAGEINQSAVLETALEDLKLADAKHRLGYVLTRAALIDLDRNEAGLAQKRATEALWIAELLERPTEIALAHVALAKAAAAGGDEEALRHHIGALGDRSLRDVSVPVRQTIEEVLADRRSADLPAGIDKAIRGNGNGTDYC